jgi:hypothetical protein
MGGRKPACRLAASRGQSDPSDVEDEGLVIGK